MVINVAKYLGKIVEVKGIGKVFNGEVKGTVIPNENPDLLVLKLSSGYNIAIKCENIDNVNVLGEAKEIVKKAKTDKLEHIAGLPKVAIISLGGTIASRVDYKTGGVYPQFTSEDLITSIPEIMQLANIDCISLMNKWSENVAKDDWVVLAKKIESLGKDKYDGFIVTIGTDTLHYCSSALSFLLEEINVPVIFVGAQRSSDRPSSDSAYNLLGALTFIKDSKKAGCFVAMHHTSDDKVIAIHLGTKVRKLHTSRRDAFHSINVSPVALVHLDLGNHKINKNEIVYSDNYNTLKNKSDKKIKIASKLSNEVALLKFYPSLDVETLDYILKKNKIVIFEGSGFGHLSDDLIEVIKKNKKTICFMTSQCIYGRVNLNVYSQGRIEQQLGIVGLEDMLSETAYTKALYVAGKTQKREEIIELMKQNLKGEISERTYYQDENLD